MEVKAFDADGATGSLVLRYGKYDESGDLFNPQPRDGIATLHLHGSDDDRATVVDAVLDSKADVIVVDIPATGQTQFEGMDAEMLFIRALEEQGVDVTCVTLATPYVESLANLNRSLDLFPNASHVFVLNEDRGDVPGDYVLYFGDNNENIAPATAKARLESLGARGAQIVLPKIAQRPLVLAAQYMLPFSAAVHSPYIRRANRLKIAAWLDRVEAAMRPADHLLGLVHSATRRVIFVLSDKGGVGKSTFSGLLWERLLHHAYGTTYAQSDIPADATVEA